MFMSLLSAFSSSLSCPPQLNKSNQCDSNGVWPWQTNKWRLVSEHIPNIILFISMSKRMMWDVTINARSFKLDVVALKLLTTHTGKFAGFVDFILKELSPGWPLTPWTPQPITPVQSLSPRSVHLSVCCVFREKFVLWRQKIINELNFMISAAWVI